MLACAVSGCKNGHKGQPNRRGISFHPFPLSNPDLLKKWLDKIGVPDFEPTENSRVCSAHFLPEDFEETEQIFSKNSSRKRRLTAKYKETFTEKSLKNCAVPNAKILEAAESVWRSMNDGNWEKAEDASLKSKRKNLLRKQLQEVQDDMAEEEPAEKPAKEELVENEETEQSAEDILAKKIHNSKRAKRRTELRRLRDQLKDFKDLEERISIYDFPPGFSSTKVEDSLLVCFHQKDPNSKIPMVRASVEISSELVLSIFLESGKPLETVKQFKLLPRTLTSFSHNTKLKRFSDLKTVMSGLKVYAGRYKEISYLQIAKDLIENFVQHMPEEAGGEAKKRKLMFLSNQLNLIQCDDMRARRYSKVTMEFVNAIVKISPKFYKQLVESDIVCLPSPHTCSEYRLTLGPKPEIKSYSKIKADTPIKGEVSASSSALEHSLDLERTGETEGATDESRVEGQIIQSFKIEDNDQDTEYPNETMDSKTAPADSTIAANAPDEGLGTVEIKRLPNAAVPFRQGIQKLKFETVIEILQKPNDNWFCNGILDRPRGGDLYLIKIDSLENSTRECKGKTRKFYQFKHRRDGYKWFVTKTHMPIAGRGNKYLAMGVELKKSYWLLQQRPTPEMKAAGKRALIDERFQRYEYTIDGNTILIHYFGNEKVATSYSLFAGRGGQKERRVPYSEWNTQRSRVRRKHPIKKKHTVSLIPAHMQQDVSLEELYADLPAYAARPFCRGAQVVNIDDIVQSLKEPTPNTITWGPLCYPKAGDVFLLDLHMYDLNGDRFIYRQDGYQWLSYVSNYKAKNWISSYKKTSWYLKQLASDDSEVAFDKRFCRSEYTLGGRYVLIRYSGDESIVNFDLMGQGEWVDEGYVKNTPENEHKKRVRVSKKMKRVENYEDDVRVDFEYEEEQEEEEHAYQPEQERVVYHTEDLERYSWNPTTTQPHPKVRLVDMQRYRTRPVTHVDMDNDPEIIIEDVNIW